MEPIQIVIVGDGCSGKTALLEAMMQTDYKCDQYKLITFSYAPTLLEKNALTLNVHGVDTNMCFHDTLGQVISKKTNVYVKILSGYN